MLTTEEAKARISLLEKTIEDQNKSRIPIIAEIKTLNKKLVEIEQIVKESNLEIRDLDWWISISRPFIKEFAQTYNLLLRKISQSQDENITVKKRNELLEKIEAIKKDLPQVCDHHFVIQHDGHIPYNPDDDFWRAEERVCLVCHVSEKGTNRNRSSNYDAQWVYKILQSISGRAIKRVCWLDGSFAEEPRLELYLFDRGDYLPLSEIQKAFLDCHGPLEED